LPAALLSALLVFCWTAADSSAAGVVVVDQENTCCVALLQSIQGFTPIGQEFIPTFAALDAVELRTVDFAGAVGGTATLRVNIREGTITGRIVGTSATLTLPPGFSGITEFGFPTLVPLSPGRRYVLEMVAVSGANWGVASSGGPNSTYPSGNQILHGHPQSDNDLWFREGLARATPLKRDYCRDSLWQRLNRTDGSRFRNQGDCIQYVNTGR
jgi:hypothetical protein